MNATQTSVETLCDRCCRYNVTYLNECGPEKKHHKPNANIVWSNWNCMLNTYRIYPNIRRPCIPLPCGTWGLTFGWSLSRTAHIYKAVRWCAWRCDYADSLKFNKNVLLSVRSEVLAVVLSRIWIFWDVTLCTMDECFIKFWSISVLSPSMGWGAHEAYLTLGR